MSYQVNFAQTQFIIDQNGNDLNSGSLKAPLKSIHRALAISNQKKLKDVQILLRAGTHYLTHTVKIGPLAGSLSISPYQNENVNISAGKKLILKFIPHKNGIYKAIIPRGINFERLYINGKLQVLARYPNYDSTARVFNGTSALAISKEKIKTWSNPKGAYIHALHAHEWGGFHYRVTDVNADGTLKMEGGWQNNRPSKIHPKYVFVENVFEELDIIGEWFLDKNASLLYYYPSKSIDLSKALIEVSNLKNSIEIIGTLQNPVKNVTIKSLNFIHNERSFWDTKEPLLRSDWTIYRGGAILLAGAVDCKITSCTFKEIGGNAIMLSNYNVNHIISKNHIAAIGASAIAVVGDTKAVRSGSYRYEDDIKYEQLDKTPGPLTANYPQQCIITDNLIHDIGKIEKQAAGVQIQIASKIQVSYNSIYNTPRAGINIGDGSFGGHDISYNDVFNTVLETGDHGAFNSWGRDRFWSPDRKYMDSLIAINPELILLDAQLTTAIHHNRFKCEHGWDIDLDDGSSNYHIYNNLCLSGGLKLREGFYRKVENNILVNNTFHPHVWFTNSKDIFKNNIVMQKYAPIQLKDWGSGIDYNFLPSAEALKFSQNLHLDLNSKFGDPMFLDWQKGNFNVANSSLALSVGFKNFEMNFGVQEPKLKAIAQTPKFDQIKLFEKLDVKNIVSFMGGKIKAVEGLGDRSAFGLSDESGVIVIEIGSNTRLANSNLKVNDVVRFADGKAIKTINDLMEVTNASNWKPSIPIIVIRNQQEINLNLLMK